MVEWRCVVTTLIYYINFKPSPDVTVNVKPDLTVLRRTSDSLSLFPFLFPSPPFFPPRRAKVHKNTVAIIYI